MNMHRPSSWPVFFIFALALGGCTNMAMKDSVLPAFARKDNELLAFARHYSELSAEGQKKEYALVTQSLSRSKNDLTSRVKAAMIFGLPASRLRDNGRALALLDEVLRDKSADADTKALAGMLKDYVSERQKFEDNAARLGQKVAEEQKRADSLQQKLDELKNIEKALIERDQARPK